MNKQVNINALFIGSYSLLLISRILVVAGSYSFPINPILIQVIYLGFLFMIYIYSGSVIKINRKIDESKVLMIILIGYLLVFGFIFINPAIKEYTQEMVQRQGMYLLIIIMTSIIIKKYRLFDEFLKTTFYTLSLVLFIQLLLHITDLRMIRISNVLNSAERIRVNFGFGHYNTVGAICACNIALWFLLKKRKKYTYAINNWIQVFFAFVSAVMLIGSASRGAITGLILYGLCYGYFNLSKKKTGRFLQVFLKIFIIMLVGFLIMFGLTDFSLDNIMMDSNRFTLFEVALPVFFNSGRTWVGLGFASGDVYGMNLTPYRTYWLDNGYIYTLVTTGYIGCLLYLIAIRLILVKVRRLIKLEIGINMLSIFVMYLYIALFETTLFNGGVVQNYIYGILFFLYLSDYFNTAKVSAENSNYRVSAV